MYFPFELDSGLLLLLYYYLFTEVTSSEWKKRGKIKSKEDDFQ